MLILCFLLLLMLEGCKLITNHKLAETKALLMRKVALMCKLV